MKSHETARKAHVTERQKAWGRLVLLTVVGLACPPLAAARSGAVWGIYLLLMVTYSLWTVHLTKEVAQETRLGYVLTAADAAVLVPMLVWSLNVAMPLVLSLLWVIGAATSWRSGRARRLAAHTTPSPRRARPTSPVPARRSGVGAAEGAPLERALRVRLRVLESEGTRFALVLLRLEGYEAMVAHSGRENTKDFLREAGDRGLRLVGPDGQLFPLPGGRIAFVFATGSVSYGPPASSGIRSVGIDPQDVESLSMAIAARACEKPLGANSLECVVGWASAPADGTDVEDLMYAAESGCLSTAAFRRVGRVRVAVPEAGQKRAIAG